MAKANILLPLRERVTSMALLTLHLLHPQQGKTSGAGPEECVLCLLEHMSWWRGHKLSFRDLG